ncbi:MAG: class I SAM-dependent methyltransferase [Deltaproteobacteria bacterium]|nr:class I SAM-dependent methyltransferase [Deltaproteobacteria bacterium]
MSTDWERKYREGFYPSSIEPHWLMQRFWTEIKFGPVLEVAIGVGRDSLFLAERGYQTIGIDISKEALKMAKEKFLEKHIRNFLLINGDAFHLPFREESFGCIVVFYFLIREKIDELKRLLKPKGLIIYETFLKRQNLVDRWRNPEYLLDDGELLRMFIDFQCVFYEEGLLKIGGKQKAIARFVGRKV